MKAGVLAEPAADKQMLCSSHNIYFLGLSDSISIHPSKLNDVGNLDRTFSRRSGRNLCFKDLSLKLVFLCEWKNIRNHEYSTWATEFWGTPKTDVLVNEKPVQLAKVMKPVWSCDHVYTWRDSIRQEVNRSTEVNLVWTKLYSVESVWVIILLQWVSSPKYLNGSWENPKEHESTLYQLYFDARENQNCELHNSPKLCSDEESEVKLILTKLVSYKCH